MYGICKTIEIRPSRKVQPSGCIKCVPRQPKRKNNFNRRSQHFGSTDSASPRQNPYNAPDTRIYLSLFADKFFCYYVLLLRRIAHADKCDYHNIKHDIFVYITKQKQLSENIILRLPENLVSQTVSASALMILKQIIPRRIYSQVVISHKSSILNIRYLCERFSKNSVCRSALKCT